MRSCDTRAKSANHPAIVYDGIYMHSQRIPQRLNHIVRSVHIPFFNQYDHGTRLYRYAIDLYRFIDASWLNSMVVCEECLTTARWLLFGFVWIAIVVIVLSLVNVYCTLRDWPRARLVKRSLIHPLPLTDVKRG
ncbi:unnamed protein product [Toxocara canis]|uniref:Transmembrane protein n=1 Tax=Toxocara canis TaxID=6265 RepID=A0A183VE78_TOXCA|nr:unnamed protein product [Toxocara canis]